MSAEAVERTSGCSAAQNSNYGYLGCLLPRFASRRPECRGSPPGWDSASTLIGHPPFARGPDYQGADHAMLRGLLRVCVALSLDRAVTPTVQPSRLVWWPLPATQLVA